MGGIEFAVLQQRLVPSLQIKLSSEFDEFFESPQILRLYVLGCVSYLQRVLCLNPPEFEQDWPLSIQFVQNRGEFVTMNRLRYDQSAQNTHCYRQTR